MGKLVHGGKVYADVVHGTAITPALITDVSGFTKVYDTSSGVDYGSLGSKVSSALDITDADVLTAYMQGGWNESHACFYNYDNKIGAYAGYKFLSEINIDKVDFWIGRYSGQNKTLYVTVQYLDSLGNWNDITTLEITSDLGYPLNVFSVYINRKCYGVRWIHSSEAKTSGNNVIFFGMCLYRYVDNDVPSPTELYSLNKSQGGVWVNTNVDMTDIDKVFFSYSSNGASSYGFAINKSDIAVYTSGGADVYTQIFSESQIGKDFNVRISNGYLYISFRSVGASSDIVSAYDITNDWFIPDSN